MKKGCILFILTLISCVCKVQGQFSFRYGSQYEDQSNKVVQTQDGNFVVVGRTNGYGSSGNAFIMKVDENGNQLWVKDYSGINIDEAFDVLENADRTLMICGLTYSYGEGNIDGFVMKTDSLGNRIWAKSYGNILGEQFCRVTHDGTGGYYLAGYAQKVNGGDQGSLVMRIDGSGGMIWSQWVEAWQPQGTGYFPIDLVAIKTGGVILTAIQGRVSCWKFSSAGNLEWSNQYSMRSWGHRITEGINGDIYISSFDYGVASSVDIAVLKIDSNGNALWQKSYGGAYNDVARSITFTSDSCLLIGAYTNSIGNGSYDACIIKIDQNGSLKWGKAYGTVWVEWLFSAAQTSDNGFILTGWTYSTGNNPDSLKIYLVKTDSSGNSTCNSVTWNPTVMNHTITASPALAIDTITIIVGEITWPGNTRNFNSVNICSTIGTDDLDIGNDIQIYPNPFTGSVSIKVEKQELYDLTLSVKNICGQIVYEKQKLDLNINDPHNFNIEFLASGIYFLELKNSDFGTLRKIIKQ